MRRALTAVVVTLITSRVSAAESPWPSAVEIATRVGYSTPAGGAARDVPQRDALAGKISLQLEGGYRVTDHIFVGGYLDYGVGVGSPVSRLFCDQTVADDCSLRDLRFGLNARVHLRPRTSFDPWIGVGSGYEVLMRRETNTSLRGWEFLNLSVGGDGALSDELVVGPFVSAAFARYTAAARTTLYSETIDSIAEPATHVWLTAGLRVAFRTMPHREAR